MGSTLLGTDASRSLICAHCFPPPTFFFFSEKKTLPKTYSITKGQDWSCMISPNILWVQLAWAQKEISKCGWSFTLIRYGNATHILSYSCMWGLHNFPSHEGDVVKVAAIQKTLTTLSCTELRISQEQVPTHSATIVCI